MPSRLGIGTARFRAAEGSGRSMTEYLLASLRRPPATDCIGDEPDKRLQCGTQKHDSARFENQDEGTEFKTERKPPLLPLTVILPSPCELLLQVFVRWLEYSFPCSLIQNEPEQVQTTEGKGIGFCITIQNR